MKNLEDYIHLYIGCNIAIREEAFLGKGLKLIGICDMGLQVRDEGIKMTFYVKPEDAKLILRPIESMTNDEVEEYAKIGDLDHNKMVSESDPFRVDKMAAMQGHWLFKNGFDVYDLIPAGLAQKREG